MPIDENERICRVFAAGLLGGTLRRLNLEDIQNVRQGAVRTRLVLELIGLDERRFGYEVELEIISAVPLSEGTD